MHFVIRLIEPHDIESILAIENRSFSLPFTRGMFEALLSQEPFGGFVAENGKEQRAEGIGQIVGYLIYSLVIDEMQLLTIAVDEPYRRRKIASQLIQKMMDVASDKKVRKIFLEVRPSNTAAQALYAKFGFKKIGLRKGYYKDNGEDAVVMAKTI